MSKINNFRKQYNKKKNDKYTEEEKKSIIKNKELAKKSISVENDYIKKYFKNKPLEKLEKELGYNPNKKLIIQFDLFTTIQTFNNFEFNNPCLFYQKDNKGEEQKNVKLTEFLVKDEKFMEKVKNSLERRNFITSDLSNYVFVGKNGKLEKFNNENNNNNIEEELISKIKKSYKDNEKNLAKEGEEETKCKNFLNKVMNDEDYKKRILNIFNIEETKEKQKEINDK